MGITDWRDSQSHILLLEQMIGSFPSDRWLAVEDNLSRTICLRIRSKKRTLSTHHSKETQVALLA